MGYDKGITKRGYGGGKQGNPSKPEPRRQEPDKLPMIADSDPAGNKVTTNYPVKESGNPNSSAGSPLKAVEGQRARGYIHNPSAYGVGRVQSGNNRRNSPPTVRKIDGP